MHRDTEAIVDKANDIKKRFGDNEKRSVAMLNRLMNSVINYEFLRDCDDELLWIEEKIREAQSADVGNSLAQVKILKRINDRMQKEVDIHDQRIELLDRFVVVARPATTTNRLNKSTGTTIKK